MASYEMLIDEEERGPIITADSAKLALVQALAEAIQWVLRGDWPEDGCTFSSFPCTRFNLELFAVIVKPTRRTSEHADNSCCATHGCATHGD